MFTAVTLAVRLASFAAALHAPVAAQHFLGFARNADAGATSRGSLGTGTGQLMTRIDGSEIAGWGTGTPGFRAIDALYFVVQDENPATVEFFDILLYAEHPTNPNLPDLANPVTFAAGVMGPTGPAAPLAIDCIVGQATAVKVPIQGGGDVFVSFRFPAAPTGDGLSLHVVLGYQAAPQFTVFDTPNHRLGLTPPPPGSPTTSYVSNLVGTTLTHAQRRQHLLDVAHSGSGGCALAITNQPSYVVSHGIAANAVPWGTADFLSGSYPDVNGNNAGRADDLAMEFLHYGLGNGAMVIFFADASPAFGAEVPLASIFAGSTGVTCLQAPQVLGFGFTQGHAAWLTTPLPAAVRPLLAGTVLRQQAVGFDWSGALHAGACDAMRF